MKPSKRSWNGEFGGFRICVGWIPTTRFCVVGCGFLCTLLISFHFTANTPRAITPRATTSHPYHHGLSRLCIHPGYHTRAITFNHTRTSGYHTRHSSSYFVFFISPAIAPPVLHHLHHHTLQPTPQRARSPIWYGLGAHTWGTFFVGIFSKYTIQ